jgi:hypothetical protein
MIVGGIKTEYIYELKRTFKLDVPPNDEGMRSTTIFHDILLLTKFTLGRRRGCLYKVVS